MFFVGGSGGSPSSSPGFCRWLHRGAVLLLILAFANQVRFSVLSYLEKEVCNVSSSNTLKTTLIIHFLLLYFCLERWSLWLRGVAIRSSAFPTLPSAQPWKSRRIRRLCHCRRWQFVFYFSLSVNHYCLFLAEIPPNQFGSLKKVVAEVVKGNFRESHYFPQNLLIFLVVAEDFLTKVVGREVMFNQKSHYKRFFGKSCLWSSYFQHKKVVVKDFLTKAVGKAVMFNQKKSLKRFFENSFW